MKTLTAALLALLAALIAFALWFYNRWKSAQAIEAAKGTLPTGGTPAQALISDTWSTAPTTVPAAVNTTFVLTVKSNEVPGLLPVTGREYIFQPSPGITIVSVTGAVAGNPNIGTTDAQGTITVVIKANNVEQPTPGALVTQQVNADSTTSLTAAFNVQ
jgi:hypothetical protein